METIKDCTHEEADTRILLHVVHFAKQGNNRISIQTVDTDIVVVDFDNVSLKYLHPLT